MEEQKEVDLVNEVNYGDIEEEHIQEPVVEQAVEAEPEQVQEEAPPQEPTAEEKAAVLGHVPKEEWRGDPAKWVPAQEFLDRS